MSLFYTVVGNCYVFERQRGFHHLHDTSVVQKILFWCNKCCLLGGHACMVTESFPTKVDPNRYTVRLDFYINFEGQNPAKFLTTWIVLSFSFSCVVSAKVISCFVVWNLVVIAAERYLAVCQPFKHNNFTRGRVLVIFSLIYITAVLLKSIATFEVRCMLHSVGFNLTGSGVFNTTL